MINNFNKALLAIGVVGLGSVISAPAFAQAFASGSSTIVLMNGASQSAGIEVGLPNGTFFDGGTYTVTPTLVGDLSTNTVIFDNVELSLGTVESVSSLGSSTTFTAAAAAKLDAAITLEETVSIIRAGAGVDGLD